jgi:16S rRNA (uracil1498-N3)-methyltransferase
MIRLFLPPEALLSKEVKISGEDARYLGNVLRVRIGEEVMIFDGAGKRYICRVTGVHRKEVVVEKIREERHSAESSLDVTVVQGIPKGEKMEMIIQKTTELGVKRLIPLITERSQIRYTGRLNRWRRIALSASQQSGRETIPVVEEPLHFNEFIDRKERYRGIIFHEGERQKGLKEILRRLGDGELFLLIGPEGGFTDEEVDQSIKKGFITASLGPRILRAETAAITAMGLIQYELGDMG